MANRSPFTRGAKVTAYLRDSGGTKQEASVERQEKEVRAWCEEHGLALTQLFRDEARTGRTDKRRDALAELMDHFRNGGEEAGVVIWNYERFARNTKHGRYYIAELEYLGKIVHSLTDDIPDGPERIIFQAFKLYSAEQTSTKISIDVTSGLRRMVEEHGGMPALPPRGMMRGEPMQIGTHRDKSPRIVHKWIPDPVLKDAVRTAFEMRANGATLRSVQDATGLYHSVNSWVTFFKNPIYKGELRFGDLVIEKYCDPIVSRELWDKVQKVSKRRSAIAANADNPRRLASPFVLSGLVYCAACGSLMSKHSIKGWNYYACSNRRTLKECKARHIPQHALENGVIELLLDQLLSLDVMLALQHRLRVEHQHSAADTRDERITLTRKLTALGKRIHNLTEAIAEVGLSDSLKRSITQAERDAADKKLELKALDEAATPPPEYSTPTLAQLADHLRESLTSDDLETRRYYLRGIVTRIEARRDDDHISGALYYVPPQTLLGHGKSAPTGTHADYLILDIPVRKHKQPARV